ncbi:MAG: hypothetical protein LIO56_05525 [Lachnospiraceae bacterium]|nr:hypothetical protein [Lachnospiraceae bacterium]
MKKAKVTVWCLVLVLCAGLFLAGCGRKVDPEEVEVVAEIISLDDEEDEMQSVGDPTATLEIQMTNELGDTITGITARLASELVYPVNMMSAGQTIENNETFRFYYDLQEAVTTTATTVETVVEEDLEENPEAAAELSAIGDNAPDWEYDDDMGMYYDDETGEYHTEEEYQALANSQTTTEEVTEDLGYCLQVTMQNNTVYEFSYFYPDDMTEVTLCVADGVPYLEYMSLKTNTMVSTLEAEKIIKANKDAAQAVIDMISAIGTVSEETVDTVSSQAAEARAAYEALTPEQQAYVTNYALLEQKESEIEALGYGGTMDEEEEEDYDYDYDEDWDDIDGYETGNESGYDDTGDWDDMDGYETSDESGYDDTDYNTDEDEDFDNANEGN